MTSAIPPALPLIVGALLVPLFSGRIRSAILLAVPAAAFVSLLFLEPGTSGWRVTFMELPVVLCRVDRISLAFGYGFTILVFIATIYGLHQDDPGQNAAALLYGGGALGVTFAGDLFSLYIFWELMAVSSTYLLLARRTADSRAAAFRYFMWHFFGGLCLLAGILLYVYSRGTTLFDQIGLSDPASALILAGFCLNAAVFPFHAWLPDAYPRATVTGAVFLSALTTKSAVYVLARCYAGTPILIWAGVVMACLPIFYGVMVNDARRVLAYSLIDQVGFMICGIGIGTPLAINGVVAHAICHILYKSLLFMSTGAVLHTTGKIRITDLGGLYRSMPFTAVCCMIGAASISAFPLFSGFVSKSMTISAAAEAHRTIVWFALVFASAGVFFYTGLKIPYFIFFGPDKGIRAKEPPASMRIAMGLAAAFCLLLGVMPAPLYAVLPYPVHYEPYTVFHVVGMLELLAAGALAFALLVVTGRYPTEQRAVYLDVDWFVRIPGRAFLRFCFGPLRRMGETAENLAAAAAARLRQTATGAVRIESVVDRIVHGAAEAAPDRLLRLLRPLRTETEQAAWNFAYILIPFIGILAVALIAAG